MAQGSADTDRCRWTILTSVAPLSGGSPAWAALGRMGLVLKVCPRYDGRDISLYGVVYSRGVSVAGIHLAEQGYVHDVPCCSHSPSLEVLPCSSQATPERAGDRETSPTETVTSNRQRLPNMRFSPKNMLNMICNRRNISMTILRRITRGCLLRRRVLALILAALTAACDSDAPSTSPTSGTAATPATEGGERVCASPGLRCHG